MAEIYTNIILLQQGGTSRGKVKLGTDELDRGWISFYLEISDFKDEEDIVTDLIILFTRLMLHHNFNMTTEIHIKSNGKFIIMDFEYFKYCKAIYRDNHLVVDEYEMSIKNLEFTIFE